MKIFTKTNILLTTKTISVALLLYCLSILPQFSVVQIATQNAPSIQFFVLWIGCVVLGFVLLRKTGYLPEKETIQNQLKKYLTPNYFLKLIGLLVLLLIISMLTTQLLRIVGLVTESDNQRVLVMIGEKIPFSVFLTMVGGAGFFEELLFRKVLYDYFEKINPIIAIGITAILFSFTHSPTELGSFVTYLTYGLFFGYLKFKTDTIIPNIIVHTAWNLFVATIIF